MPALVLALLATLAYLAAALLQAQALRGPDGESRAGMALALPAALLHLIVHGLSWTQGAAPPMHFFAALSLVGVGMAALTALAGRWQRLEALGVVVFPIAAASLLLYVALGREGGAVLTDWRIALHAWLALLAYAALAVGALLAIMLWLQERALRRRQLGQAMRLLPPLTQLEILLFRTIAAGFALLTLALLSGGLFVQDLLAQHLAHKTVLSILAWVIFAVLLLGRWRLGWRGRRAVRLTLGAMSLLLLAFFGSKFVLELILQRGAG